MNFQFQQLRERIGAAFGHDVLNVALYALSSDIKPGHLQQAKQAVFDRLVVETSSDISDFLQYEFLYDPLIDLRHVKQSSSTKIFGGPTVTESAGETEVRIRIRGVMWDKQGFFPESQLSRFLEIFRQDTYLDVTQSKLLRIHGVDAIYLDEVDTPAFEGYVDTQPYTISARSVTPVDLELQE